MAKSKTAAVKKVDTGTDGSDSGMRRRYARRSVLWPATLAVGKHVFTCHIWNLSLGGARVRVNLPLKDGTAIVLEVPDRGELPGQVVWADDEALGLDFTVPESTVRKMFHDRLHVLGLDELPEYVEE